MSRSPLSAHTDGSPREGRTHIHVLCSPHAHVGTTLTARLLTDFLISQSGNALGFDTNHLDPGLAAVFPRDVAVVDLFSTRGQMTLFDSLIEDDKIPKIVDLWHVSYDRFFKQAEEIGFFEEAYKRDLKCIFFLHMDPKLRFARELGNLRSRYPRADTVLVENEALSDFQRQPTSSTSLAFDQRRLFVPELSSTVCYLLQQPEILIYRFVSMVAPHDLRMLQDEFRKFLLPVFKQFEVLEAATELGLPMRSLLPRKR